VTIDELLRTHDATLASMRSPLPVILPLPRSTSYVHPGRMFFSADATDVTTILGSCVAVCIWDAVSGIGGLNHYMLPAGTSTSADARYGAYAIPQLIESVLNLGASSVRLQAKVFGGARVLRELQPREGGLGQRNVELAQELLERERVPVVFEDVGGQNGRKLVFRTDDGGTHVRRL
jgi:chemotaxis protein CheD